MLDSGKIIKSDLPKCAKICFDRCLPWHKGIQDPILEFCSILPCASGRLALYHFWLNKIHLTSISTYSPQPIIATHSRRLNSIVFSIVQNKVKMTALCPNGKECHPRDPKDRRNAENGLSIWV